MPYHLEGRLLELCTCGAQCPCQPSGQRDSGDCDAVNAWHIERGDVGGTDVAGLTLVTLSRIHGHVLEGRPVVFYVDDQASAVQEEALLNVWTGKLGGPVADLAALMGDVTGVERATMAFDVRDGQGFLTVGQVVEARLAPQTHGGTSHGDVPHSDVCTTIPGSETNLAEAATYHVDSPSYGFALDLQNHAVLQGRFRFDG